MVRAGLRKRRIQSCKKVLKSVLPCINQETNTIQKLKDSWKLFLQELTVWRATWDSKLRSGRKNKKSRMGQVFHLGFRWKQIQSSPCPYRCHWNQLIFPKKASLSKYSLSKGENGSNPLTENLPSAVISPPLLSLPFPSPLLPFPSISHAICSTRFCSQTHGHQSRGTTLKWRCINTLTPWLP